MQFKLDDVSLEFLGFGNKAKKRIEKIQQLAADFEMRADIFGRELEDVYANLDKEVMDDLHEKGDVVGQGPSSKQVHPRNQQFINLLKHLLNYDVKEIPIREDMEAVYEKFMDAKYIKTFDPEVKGFMLKPLDKKDIVYPTSGWFGFPGTQVERTCKAMSPLFRDIAKKLRGIQEKDVEDRETYARISMWFMIFEDVYRVVQSESIDWISALE